MDIESKAVTLASAQLIKSLEENNKLLKELDEIRANTIKSLETLLSLHGVELPSRKATK